MMTMIQELREQLLVTTDEAQREKLTAQIKAIEAEANSPAAKAAFAERMKALNPHPTAIQGARKKGKGDSKHAFVQCDGADHAPAAPFIKVCEHGAFCRRHPCEECA